VTLPLTTHTHTTQPNLTTMAPDRPAVEREAGAETLYDGVLAEDVLAELVGPLLQARMAEHC